MSWPPRIITGADLSLTSTGVARAVLPDLSDEPGRVSLIVPPTVSVSLIKPRLRTGHLRLAYILTELEIAGLFSADLAVIEGPSLGSEGGQAHERAGLWWLVVHELWRREVKYAVLAPTTLRKYATGKGSESKDAALAAAVRRFPAVEVNDNNEADALWLAAAGCQHYRVPICTVPEAQSAGLEAQATSGRRKGRPVIHWPA